ncbi:CDCA2 protein, partial [Calyptomena viridis]|nr:CDCA2 protein [Calyptomena viridis]
STIGLRGSPENNTLIQYLAQQRSTRQREPFTQISPFKYANVRSLKDKIEAFQTSFESLQEAEGETGLSQVDVQNKTPFKTEQKVEQRSEKLMLDRSGAALKDNLSAKVPKCEPRICSFSSPHPGTVTEPAPKEWVYEQQNPAEPLETVGPGEMLETPHGKRIPH